MTLFWFFEIRSWAWDIDQNKKIWATPIFLTKSLSKSITPECRQLQRPAIPRLKALVLLFHMNHRPPESSQAKRSSSRKFKSGRAPSDHEKTRVPPPPPTAIHGIRRNKMAPPWYMVSQNKNTNFLFCRSRSLVTSYKLIKLKNFFAKIHFLFLQVSGAGYRAARNQIKKRSKVMGFYYALIQQ